MSPTISMSRRDSSMARNAPSFSRTCSSRPSFSKTSRFASATAAHIGCPPHVKPWANEFVPSRNGSIMSSDAMTAPIGADDLVGDQQDVVPVADLADALEVALGRREAAAGVLDGLHDHRGDRVGALDLDPVRDGLGELLGAVAGRQAV